MRLHHIVEHIIGRVEESYRTQGEGSYEIITAQSGCQCLINDIANHGCTQTELNPNDVERNHIGGEEQEDERNADSVCKNRITMFLITRIGTDHTCRKYLHQQKHHKLTDGSILILDTYYEIDHHGHSRKEDASGHSLAIEHEEKGRIDQC